MPLKHWVSRREATILNDTVQIPEGPVVYYEAIKPEEGPGALIDI